MLEAPSRSSSASGRPHEPCAQIPDLTGPVSGAYLLWTSSDGDSDPGWGTKLASTVLRLHRDARNEGLSLGLSSGWFGEAPGVAGVAEYAGQLTGEPV